MAPGFGLRLSLGLVLGAGLLAGVAAGCGGGADERAAAGRAAGGGALSIARALRAPADMRGFARALAPRPFVFPADHGPHPDFRTEWWYFTGNLVATDGGGRWGSASWGTGGRNGIGDGDGEGTGGAAGSGSAPALRGPGTAAGGAPGSGGSEGRRFGFQLTFFRTALAPPPAPAPGAPGATGTGGASGATASGRTSAWVAREVWFAHFAVTDIAGRRFHCYERWERQALGLAGAAAVPFRVWVGDWSATAAPLPAPSAKSVPSSVSASPAPPPDPASDRAVAASGRPPSGGAVGAVSRPVAELAAAGTPPLHLRAAAGGTAANAADGRDTAPDGAGGAFAGQCPGSGRAAIDLLLTGGLQPVPQGDHGLSAKGGGPGNASYYYSLPRLAAAGTLSLDGRRVPVAGLAWMDREWSTSALGAGETGWDWFALQLDDGWELMLYRLRRRGELTDAASLATLIAPNGHTERFAPASWRLEETSHWTSPSSRVRYPSGWHLAVSAGGDPAALDLTVRPLLAGQELLLALRYWEGAVEVRGSHAGRPVAGRGYVELTGYGDLPPTVAVP